MGPVTHYDLVIIGTGSGNSILDQRFAGWRVAIVVDMTVYGTRIHLLQIVGIVLICGASLANSLGTAQRAGRAVSAGRSA
jgi:mycothione reductase